MASTAKLQIETVLSGVTVRPGDTLVVFTPRQISMKEADDYKQLIEARLPGVKFLIVDNCSGMAVYRPDETAMLRERVRRDVYTSYGVSPEEVFGPQQVLDECGLPPEGSRM